MAVDRTGPSKVQVRGKPYEFNALICIDKVTDLVELVRIDHTTSHHTTSKFAQSWVTRYPWPKHVSTIMVENSYDGNSKSFFKKLTRKTFRWPVEIPQQTQYANICINQLVTYWAQYYMWTHEEKTTKANELIDDSSSTAQHGTRTSAHTILGSNPGALVFSCEMFLNVPLLTDWHAITEKKRTPY